MSSTEGNFVRFWESVQLVTTQSAVWSSEGEVGLDLAVQLVTT